ncbi:hypothetical protein L0669_13360 [Flavobacterium bizetiae]|uniref:pPIWI-associating nuclease domain-containing protein n=1 Tax=Flavobacterium bizetiae TaxID=2704140 RepID=UPI0021E7A273|nr:hypothetical protein [Flavobacterium bizetiae]UTN02307.1 hypothetical protein L0669_13360 [Flavobacterium bizetiae]
MVDKIELIKKLLNSDFEKNLFEASLWNLQDRKNKLRFNNFAYSIRELSRHFLYSLSPDENILKCSWYKNETDKKNGVTRAQRIKYAIQSGLDDKFVNDNLIDLEEIKEIRIEIAESIDVLNKYTHINPNSFDIEETEIEYLSNNVIKALYNFASTILQTKKQILDALDNEINEEFIQRVVYENIDEISLLSTHQSVHAIVPEQFNLKKIDSNSIYIDVEGYVEVTLQWGSNSDLKNDIGAEMHTSFPFCALIKIKIEDDIENADIEFEKFDVDVSDWYE